MTALDELIKENARMRAALAPSAETKASYIGEFHVDFRELDEFGAERWVKVPIPWDKVKEIMAAIRKHAGIDGQSEDGK